MIVRSIPQIGTVMDDAADFYHARVPKKERKKTLVDELLADAEAYKYMSILYWKIKGWNFLFHMHFVSQTTSTIDFHRKIGFEFMQPNLSYIFFQLINGGI